MHRLAKSDRCELHETTIALPGLRADFAAAVMPEPSPEPSEPLDGVEQSLEELQEERCVCLEQLRLLLADGPASDKEISRYVERIDAINGIMLSLARATTAFPALESSVATRLSDDATACGHLPT